MSVSVPSAGLTHSRCVWLARELFLAQAASAKCHKYFPLLRNDSGFSGWRERRRRGWMYGGGIREGATGREVDEKSITND